MGHGGNYETVDEINKNIRSQEIQPTLNLVFNHLFFFLNLDLGFFKLKKKYFD